MEKVTFTPAVFSTSGGMGKEADRLLRRMAERMSIKRGENYSNYSSVVSLFRRRFFGEKAYFQPTINKLYMMYIMIK